MCNNVSVDTINEVMKYFHADGCANNMNNMLRYLADHLFKFGYEYAPAVTMPDHGLYHPKFDGAENTMAYLQECFEHSDKPTVACSFPGTTVRETYRLLGSRMARLLHDNHNQLNNRI